MDYDTLKNNYLNLLEEYKTLSATFKKLYDDHKELIDIYDRKTQDEDNTLKIIKAFAHRAAMGDEFTDLGKMNIGGLISIYSESMQSLLNDYLYQSIELGKMRRSNNSL